MARMSYTTAEYLDQEEFYFSESAHGPVQIENMAPQYALNAYRKLINEFGIRIAGRPLAVALAKRIGPDMPDLREMLEAHGRARILMPGLTESGARARLRRAGASRTRKEGEWIVGEKDADIQVSVKKVKH